MVNGRILAHYPLLCIYHSETCFMIPVTHCHLYCSILVKRNNLKNSFCNFLHDLSFHYFSAQDLKFLNRSSSSASKGKFLTGFPVARLWPRNAYTLVFERFISCQMEETPGQIVSPQKRPNVSRPFVHVHLYQQTDMASKQPGR